MQIRFLVPHRVASELLEHTPTLATIIRQERLKQLYYKHVPQQIQQVVNVTL